MTTDTLVEGMRPPGRPKGSHRATTTSTRSRAVSTPGYRGTAASAPTQPGTPRSHEGKVYRTTYVPPSLVVVLVGLYLLVLIAGVAFGMGVMSYGE